MQVVIGEANDQLIGGVLGMVKTDTLVGTSAGVVGLAGPSAATDDWNGQVESQGQPVTAAVLGAGPIVSKTGFPAWDSIGYLAGGPGFGVFGESQGNDGVQGKSHSKDHSGVAGINDGGGSGVLASSDGVGVYVEAGTFAGVFNGAVVVNKSTKLANIPDNQAAPIDGCIVINEGSLFLNNGDVIVQKGEVKVSGNLTMLNGGDVILADCAEEFQCSDGSGVINPGSVVALGETGDIRPCSKPYDKRAVGVVSGAGPYRPAIVLDRVESAADRVPVALVGKVCCKVDAQYGAIEIGDLLTTSLTAGHAMKATDPLKAFGAVIGKALHPLAAGQGLIPILVALQ